MAANLQNLGQVIDNRYFTSNEVVEIPYRPHCPVQARQCGDDDGTNHHPMADILSRECTDNLHHSNRHDASTISRVEAVQDTIPHCILAGGTWNYLN